MFNYKVTYKLKGVEHIVEVKANNAFSASNHINDTIKRARITDIVRL